MHKVGNIFAVLLQHSHALPMKFVEQVTVHLKQTKTLQTPKHSFPLEIPATSVVKVRMGKVPNIPLQFSLTGHNKDSGNLKPSSTEDKLNRRAHR